MKLRNSNIPDKAIRQNFEQLEQVIATLVAAVGGKNLKLAFGSGTVAFAAGTTSSVTNVTHGLSGTPKFAYAIEDGTGFGVIFRIPSRGATTFSVVATNPFGAGTYAAGFTWVALG